MNEPVGHEFIPGHSMSIIPGQPRYKTDQEVEAFRAGRASRDAEIAGFQDRLTHASLNYINRADAARKYMAERDALQAQLDAMITEWSAPDTGSILMGPFPFGYGEDEEMARRAAAVLHGPVFKRLVGPWVEAQPADK